MSGGGTGGHIFPAVAIAQTIKKKYPDAQIVFVGAKGRMEMEKVPAAGFKIHGLWISGFQRGNILKNLTLPLKIVHSLIHSFLLIIKYKPIMTIGVGGYASGPLNFMASIMGKPVLLQEQNSFAGITNKLLKNRAKTICVAYDGMERFFSKNKIVFTGNPIRQELLYASDGQEEARKYFSIEPNKFTLLAMGGSLGAPAINQALDKIISELEKENIQIIWQTGRKYKGEHGNFSFGLRTAFIQRMDLAYAAADIVISRAGAIAISEMMALRKASILVPSPFVAENHQLKNAQALVEKNAAILCEQKDINEQLLPQILNLKNDSKKIKEIEENTSILCKTNATELILQEIEKLL